MVVSVAQANNPPQMPTITEPLPTRIVNPADLHMESSAFNDADPGDQHACTDWEIRRADNSEQVWLTSCIGGVERLHTHLGDGTFLGSLAGRRELNPSTQYRLRTRHKDSSGIALTEWSPWAEVLFTTGTISQLFPLELEDVLDVPSPILSVPIPNSTPPASFRVESGTGNLLLQIQASQFGNSIFNPAALATHAPVKLVVTAGASALNLQASQLIFNEDDGSAHTIYIPAIALAPTASKTLWIARSGATYYGQTGQTVPDFSSLARGAPVPWFAANDVAVEIVATGFQLPVSIAFVPNPLPQPTAPYYYVAELYGIIKVVRRDGTVLDYATGLVNFDPTGLFPGSGEQGLAGIVVDPTNGDLFATVLYSATPSNPNAPHHPKVIRLHSTDGGLTASSNTTILNLAPSTQGQSHQISNISFGPDNNLYVHVGDGFQANFAQDLSSALGKILRLDRNGQPIPSNPNYNLADGITPRDYVYASGVRNPFGGAWRLSDSSHFIIENGPSVDRITKLVLGRNYLWDGSDASMQNFAIYNWNPATGPVCGAVIQNEVFGGSGFPASYFGRLYVTQSSATYGGGPGSTSAKSITEWIIDSAGALTSGGRAVCFYDGGGKSTTAALAAGPDGLYFSDLYKEDETVNPIARGANILRLRYNPVVPLDCNGNTVPDLQDILAGTSQDCNQNGVPDECDIAIGRSDDCNFNGIPDDCDTVVAVTANFDTSLSPYVVNGSAVRLNNAVRLTPATGSQNGTLIRPPLSASPISSFDVSFDLRIGGGSGADGLCFAAFDANLYPSTALFSEEGPTLPGSLVVQFDTYDNGGEGENSIDVEKDGVLIAHFGPSFDLEDNQIHRASVKLRNGLLNVSISRLDGSIEHAFTDLPVSFAPMVARFGFGGRTGGATNEHWIDNVTFRVPSASDANGDGVPDECVCPADFNRDGTLDFFDYLDFVDSFSSNDSAADFNHDLIIDFFDYLDFVDAFSVGC